MSFGRFDEMTPRERLVLHVQTLEHLQELKDQAAEDLRRGFEDAKAEGYDAATLRVVLKLRRMTPNQRRERRALEAIYMAALGMLEGEALPEEARRRLDEPSKKEEPPAPPEDQAPSETPDTTAPAAETAPPTPAPSDPPADSPAAENTPPTEVTSPAPHVPEQPPLIVKDPAEAKQEGADAAAAGKRIYDNPYPAGDPCRAAWDEGWCGQRKSHGMETPTAYQRRTEKAAKKPDGPAEQPGSAESQRGAA